MSIPSKISRKLTGVAPWRMPLFHSLRASLFLVIGSSLLLFPTTALSQVTAPAPPPGFPSAGPPPRTVDPSMRRMDEHMAMERNTERQQKIVADTARLLDLAKELNDAVSHSTKNTLSNTLSIAVVKKAEEIEKLAKTIKDKMRDGE
jgi:hypothetical protein